MQNDVIINFEHVSKKFQKGKRLYLKQALLDFFKPSQQKDFLALKGVSFKVKRGESIGIIGANGSGKSTILKIIAGVLTPTEGKVEVKGTVGPLIELGAGFHPELSGRDNIYLNGTILGLSKKSIDEKFEQIVSFAELEEFIDTPVKHYSSGMYMRLGFSIAVHINPDILLIDEILAVGDIYFQKKCSEAVSKYLNKNRTVILVSHDMEMIRNYCSRVLLLKKGRIVLFEDIKKIPFDYLKIVLENKRPRLNIQSKHPLRFGDGKVKITDIWIEDNLHKKISILNNEIININIKVKFYSNAMNPIFGIIIKNNNGSSIFDSNTQRNSINSGAYKRGDEKIVSWKINNYFETGEYTISAGIAYQDAVNFYDWREQVKSFLIKKSTKGAGVLNFKHKIKIQ